MLLTQWETNIGPEVIASIEKAGKDFYDVLKLASIVERETAVDSEKVKVAGVYTNRLNGLAGPAVPERRADRHLRQRRHQAAQAADCPSGPSSASGASPGSRT